ncbi:hypothetical protein [Nesterenkonia pannonica]|uniref:shikimate kinase n=1 Tax=Nesterenkonia pannonica TaxID=1548602 RepID=UPI0021644121|nr:shikimate kinase [Nesterenkonia pannonica]
MLDVTEEQALARIGDAVTRPLLKGNPAAVWKGIYQEREHLYRQCADLVIDASHHSVEARVDTIEKELPSREELRS